MTQMDGKWKPIRNGKKLATRIETSNTICTLYEDDHFHGKDAYTKITRESERHVENEKHQTNKKKPYTVNTILDSKLRWPRSNTKIPKLWDQNKSESIQVYQNKIEFDIRLKSLSSNRREKTTWN